MINWGEIAHFRSDEFLHPELLNPTMAYMLDDLRQQYGKPLLVSSSYRDDISNARVAGAKDSSHIVDGVTGYYSGVDLTVPGNKIRSQDMFKLVRIALALGFRRCGLYRDHLHLDLETRLPQDVIWLA